MKTLSNFPLKEISWIKIGGNVSEYYETATTSELIDLIKKLHLDGKEFEILGWGANTLISDKGLDKVLIKNSSKEVEVIGKNVSIETNNSEDGLTRQREDESRLNESRFESSKNVGTFRGIEFKDLDYDESDKEDILVKVASGLGLPIAINSLIKEGFTGLQWFSGVPGQLGSAVFNNIHGGTHLLVEYIDSVEVMTRDGEMKTLTKDELKFQYDSSILQDTKDIILKVNLKLKLGDKSKAEHTSIEWARRKISQPKNSLGSVFKNISKEDQARLNFPTPSIGYLVEHELKLSGYKVGDAQVAPTSNNFIVNLGNATSEDYLGVMKKVKSEAKEKFNLNLIPEIFFMGFDPEELKDIKNS